MQPKIVKVYKKDIGLIKFQSVGLWSITAEKCVGSRYFSFLLQCLRTTLLYRLQVVDDEQTGSIF